MPNPTTTRDYVMGNSAQERQRLKVQAGVVGGWTGAYLQAAGLAPGMHVLDVGTGMGDVALLAAGMVGPNGSVLAIDRDPVIIESAKERIALESPLAPIHLLHTGLIDFQPSAPFDAVIGRYVLLYQPDAAKALRHAATLLRPGGILCFHEMAFGRPTRSYPEENLFSSLLGLIGEVFRRLNLDPDMGLHLAKTFTDAGLPRPDIKADLPVGGENGSYLYHWGAETLRTLLPRIEQLGLGTAADLQVDTLSQRFEAEALQHPAEWLGPLQFGAWLRIP